MFKQAGFELDRMRVEFIMDGVVALGEELNEKVQRVEANKIVNRVLYDEAAKEAQEKASEVVKKNTALSASHTDPSGKELDDLITQVTMTVKYFLVGLTPT